MPNRRAATVSVYPEGNRARLVVPEARVRVRLATSGFSGSQAPSRPQATKGPVVYDTSLLKISSTLEAMVSESAGASWVNPTRCRMPWIKRYKSISSVV